VSQLEKKQKRSLAGGGASRGTVQKNQATLRHLTLSEDYSRELNKLEQRGNLEDNPLALYFATVGMDDADIAHSIMAVKEMIHYGYELNDAQFDELIANGVILDGELPFG
jgi:hypothetical protein